MQDNMTNIGESPEVIKVVKFKEPFIGDTRTRRAVTKLRRTPDSPQTIKLFNWHQLVQQAFAVNQPHTWLGLRLIYI